MNIIDLRRYSIIPGRVNEYVEFFRNEGLPIQASYLGCPLGYFVTETGPLNQVVHMWAYETMADREQRRSALEKDPKWVAYRKKSTNLALILAQENTLLKALTVPCRFATLD
ncbi:NIPSNAP family protein (plasmid) [Sulfitobacter sp. OXR-159]|uniref:NIPSNAP family protein n=1 Tax=Sulfitobacter sp. OXR-159 TaxID=3100174 RepID=UPI002AC97692|nr:NIPSNAP family protein [Sulfitobacter sp. OXR-159]WPZ32098.1 NIPSNAP family protein [Sulfitobacter sp. OXR-159]|tara:strand:- start:115 stop:450 length:336 start_codon:yes stop_codon:yes gene_type:complete